MAPKTKMLVLEDREIIFPNFSGTANMYNREGRRSFNVILKEEEVQDLLEAGWNVKRTKPREGGDLGTPRLEVRANFESALPPRVTVISHTTDAEGQMSELGRTRLTADTVNTLDWADIVSADMTVNPYHWDLNGKSGITAYLQTLVVHVLLDPIEAKYAEEQAVDAEVDEG